MAINLSDNLLSKTTAPADAKYGPYFGATENDAIAAALGFLIPSYRYEGLKIGLKIGTSDIVEYWFVGGVADGNLTIKATSTYSGETGQSIVSKLESLPLNEMLTTANISYNSDTLKAFLDGLNFTGGTSGDLEVAIRYQGNYLSGVLVQIYSQNGTLYNTITTTNSIVFTAIPVGTYAIQLLLPSGYVSNTITMNDYDNLDNVIDVLNSNISGVTINSNLKCAIVVDIYPADIPFINEMLINNGDTISSVSLVNITVDAIGIVDEYMLSESPTFLGASWIPYSNTIQYYKDYISETTLTLYFKFKNLRGTSNTVSDSIILTNGFQRSDSVKTYNTIDLAVADIIADYGGNLTTGVTLSCMGATVNIRTSGKFLLEIADLNVNSSHFLIIDGKNNLTLDCASLGGIKIKNSKNILIRNINFTKVGSELQTAVPEELAALFVQGIATAKCSNIAIENCIINGIETLNGVTKRGDYSILAKNMDNFSVINCTISNFNATSIKTSFVDNLNIIKNTFVGSQVRAIVSQPCHISSTNGNIVNITDNDFNGTTFDTGLILDAINVSILRNKFYNFGGECIRMNNTNQGVLFNMMSNVMYNNLLSIPYSWVKYDILFNSSFDEVRFVSNTVEMRGINYSGVGESLIRAYSCVITKLIFSNNIIRYKYNSPPYTTNQGGGLTLNGAFTQIVSNHNVYIDDTLDGNTLNNSVYQWKRKLTDLVGLGLEINSVAINQTSIVFVNELTRDYHLTLNGATLTASSSGDISSIDKDYKSGSTHAGAYGFAYATIDESDVSTDYVATNVITHTGYTTSDVIQAFSTEKVLFETLNKKRNVVLTWKITNTANPNIYGLLLGVSGLVGLVSNLNPDGTYLSDATYDIDINII